MKEHKKEKWQRQWNNDSTCKLQDAKFSGRPQLILAHYRRWRTQGPATKEFFHNYLELRLGFAFREYCCHWAVALCGHQILSGNIQLPTRIPVASRFRRAAGVACLCLRSRTTYSLKGLKQTLGHQIRIFFFVVAVAVSMYRYNISNK